MPEASGETRPDESKLEDVVRFLLNHHTFLHEKRIQKLVFLADLHSIQTRGKRLVEADFKRYYYGVYSEKVALTLQSLEGVRVRPEAAPDGTSTIVFLRPKQPLATPHLTEDDQRILEEVLKAYKAVPTEDLAEMGKATLLWESAEFGQALDYDAYLKDPASRLTPAMKEAFEAALLERRRGRLKTFADVDEMYAGPR